MCTRQRLRTHAHKLTIVQNVSMVHERTACAHENACVSTRTSSPLDRMCQWSTSAHAHKPFGRKVHMLTLSIREGPIWRARNIYSPVPLSRALDHTSVAHILPGAGQIGWRTRDIYSPVPLSLDHTSVAHILPRGRANWRAHILPRQDSRAPSQLLSEKGRSYTIEAFPLSDRPCYQGMARAQVCIRCKAIATYTTCLPTDSRYSKRPAQQSTQTVSEQRPSIHPSCPA